LDDSRPARTHRVPREVAGTDRRASGAGRATRAASRGTQNRELHLPGARARRAGCRCHPATNVSPLLFPAVRHRQHCRPCAQRLYRFAELRKTADLGAIWPGVATLLVIVSDYVEKYGGEPVSLPPEVIVAARFSGRRTY